jgi:hypothetical protein
MSPGLSRVWPTPAGPAQPKRKRSPEPHLLAGLTHKPPCALCDHEKTGETAPAPPRRPDPMPPTRRRPRTVDTAMPFCPHTACAYRAWQGLKNLRANGHPNGGPGRQCHGTACKGYLPEHHGTLLHGKQSAVELIVRVLALLGGGARHTRHRAGLGGRCAHGAALARRGGRAPPGLGRLFFL